MSHPVKLQFTDQTTAFIAKLVALQPRPDSIWLIGSRANERATQESDTDLIVFGSVAFLGAARSQLEQPQAVDCLVVFNGDDYQDPWQEKSGSLRQLQWQQVNNDVAKYIGTKWVPDEEFEFDADIGDLMHRQERAVRVWP